jgi:hypothetical protein
VNLSETVGAGPLGLLCGFKFGVEIELESAGSKQNGNALAFGSCGNHAHCFFLAQKFKSKLGLRVLASSLRPTGWRPATGTAASLASDLSYQTYPVHYLPIMERDRSFRNRNGPAHPLKAGSNRPSCEYWSGSVRGGRQRTEMTMESTNLELA